jgi:hypothetical protein
MLMPDGKGLELNRITEKKTEFEGKKTENGTPPGKADDQSSEYLSGKDTVPLPPPEIVAECAGARLELRSENKEKKRFWLVADLDPKFKLCGQGGLRVGDRNDCWLDSQAKIKAFRKGLVAKSFIKATEDEASRGLFVPAFFIEQEHLTEKGKEVKARMVLNFKELNGGFPKHSAESVDTVEVLGKLRQYDHVGKYDLQNAFWSLGMEIVQDGKIKKLFTRVGGKSYRLRGMHFGVQFGPWAMRACTTWMDKNLLGPMEDSMTGEWFADDRLVAGSDPSMVDKRLKEERSKLEGFSFSLQEEKMVYATNQMSVAILGFKKSGSRLSQPVSDPESCAGSDRREMASLLAKFHDRAGITGIVAAVHYAISAISPKGKASQDAWDAPLGASEKAVVRSRLEVIRKQLRTEDSVAWRFDAPVVHTDASDTAWGGIALNNKGEVVWRKSGLLPVHVEMLSSGSREAHGANQVIKQLLKLDGLKKGATVFIDSKNLLQAAQRFTDKKGPAGTAFQLWVVACNFAAITDSLEVTRAYINTESNKADKLSRFAPQRKSLKVRPELRPNAGKKLSSRLLRAIENS